ncbi:hypothetical protein ACQ4PT_056335 [Festuca glaucescens]
MAQSPPGFPSISPPPPPSWLFHPLPQPLPPPSLLNHKPSTSQGRIIAIVTSLLCTTVCTLCRAYCHRRAHAAATAANTGVRPSPPSLEHGSGHVEERPLWQAYAASTMAGLPAFMYSQSVKHNLPGGGEEAATCSVCLGELRLGETVRLLPVCLHLYHAECIDPWLNTHSTCPLCRSDTDPTTGIRLPDV